MEDTGRQRQWSSLYAENPDRSRGVDEALGKVGGLTRTLSRNLREKSSNGVNNM